MGKGNLISVIISVALIGLVLGLSSYNEPASGGIVSFPPTEDACDFSGVQQHWDKIIFKTKLELKNDFPPPASPLILVPGGTYDIKVVQDPISVTSLESVVAKFLNDSGYKLSADGSKVFPRFINIVDVEYEIACPLTGPPVVDVDMDGFSPPEDCDDGDPFVNPGAAEIPYDGIDQDCSGADLTDVDADGFDSTAVGGTDCDDGDPLVNPGATEFCNFIDDNCNGMIDEGGVCLAADGGAMSNYLPLSINSLGFK